MFWHRCVSLKRGLLMTWQYITSSSVEAMACHLLGAKPKLPETMPKYCQSELKYRTEIEWNLNRNRKDTISRKHIIKCYFSFNVFIPGACTCSVDTWNNVIMTPKRRRDVVLTSLWGYYCTVCPLGDNDKTSYRKMSRSLKPARLSVKILISHRNWAGG